MVFRRLLLPLLEATGQPPADSVRTSVPDQVWTQFASLFARLNRRNASNTLRRKVLLKHSPAGTRIKTTKTCLWCLTRAPERSLRCGHSICEECLDVYYPPGTSVYAYEVDRCLVCGFSTSTTLRVKPPTVMPSLLGFDGGGIRGIVALILTKRLQDILDVPYPLWQFFHSVIGTSVGKLSLLLPAGPPTELRDLGGVIVLDMVVGRSTIEESLTRFTHWVTEIFPVKQYHFLPRLRKILDFLIGLLRDGQYDCDVLETVMQQAFGRDEILFDTNAQNWLGTKVGVTATTVSEVDLRIFTNYNGQGRRQRDTGNAYTLGVL